MASHRSSLVKTLVCTSIVMAMLLLVDVTAADNPQLSSDVVAGLTQQAYLRGNTDVSGTKKGAVVTEEMHVGDSSFDFFSGDYVDGRNPSANCRNKWDCPKHRP